jgi:hypothetical protein
MESVRDGPSDGLPVASLLFSSTGFRDELPAGRVGNIETAAGVTGLVDVGIPSIRVVIGDLSRLGL